MQISFRQLSSYVLQAGRVRIGMGGGLEGNGEKDERSSRPSEGSLLGFWYFLTKILLLSGGFKEAFFVRLLTRDLSFIWNTDSA